MLFYVIFICVVEVTDLMMAIPAGRNYIFDQAKKAVLKQTKGLYPAPLKIIEVVKNGIENPSTGYEMEAKVCIHL